jgi:hypothetical protein
MTEPTSRSHTETEFGELRLRPAGNSSDNLLGHLGARGPCNPPEEND